MRRDGVLVELVLAINDGAARVPIVLLMGGALVTGQVASASDYIAAHPGSPADPSPDYDRVNVMHLAEATVNGQHLGWWRVQLEGIGGFSMPGATTA